MTAQSVTVISAQHAATYETVQHWPQAEDPSEDQPQPGLPVRPQQTVALPPAAQEGGGGEEGGDGLHLGRLGGRETCVGSEVPEGEEQRPGSGLQGNTNTRSLSL